RILGGTANDIFNAKIDAAKPLPIVVFSGGGGADNKASIVVDPLAAAANDKIEVTEFAGDPATVFPTTLRGDFEFKNIMRATVDGGNGDDTIYFNANTSCALLGGTGNDI